MDQGELTTAADRLRVLTEENRLLRESAMFFADLAERLHDRLQHRNAGLGDDERGASPEESGNSADAT